MCYGQVCYLSSLLLVIMRPTLMLMLHYYHKLRCLKDPSKAHGRLLMKQSQANNTYSTCKHTFSGRRRDVGRHFIRNGGLVRWTFFKKSTLTVCASMDPENLFHNRIRSDKRTDVSSLSSYICVQTRHICNHKTRVQKPG